MKAAPPEVPLNPLPGIPLMETSESLNINEELFVDVEPVSGLETVREI